MPSKRVADVPFKVDARYVRDCIAEAERRGLWSVALGFPVMCEVADLLDERERLRAEFRAMVEDVTRFHAENMDLRQKVEELTAEAGRLKEDERG